MSGRPEMSTTLQDPNVEPASSASPIIALIGPNATHRRVMAKALSSSDARNVREFIDYPANLGDIPHLMEERFDVLMIDVDSDQSYALQIIESIAAYNTTVVMAYSMRNDPDLIQDCMRAGARDFLPLPEEASVAAEPEMESEAAIVPEPQPVSRTEPVPRPVPRSDPFVSRPQPVSEAAQEPRVNPADFLRSEPAAPEVKEEPPPLNPADFLLATPREVSETSAPAPSFQPKEYSVPSRPQFVDPRRSAPQAAPPAAAHAPFQPMPKPVAKAAQQPIPLPPPPQAAEPRHSAPPPVLPEELRRSAGPPKPTQQAQPPEGKKDEIDAWDSLWIKPALGGAAKAVEPTPAPAAEAPAKKKPAQPAIQSGPQLVAQRSAAKAEAPVPSAPAPAPPMFRAVDSESSAQGLRPWVRWAILGGVALAIIALVMMVFMPSRRASAPASPQIQPAATQAQSPAADTAFPVSPEPTPKPSAGTPVKAEEEPTASVSSAMMDAQLHAPSRISGALHRPAQQADEPPTGFTTGGIESSGSLPGQVFGPARGVKVVPGVSAISAGVAEGMLVHKTAPVYPEIAKSAHVSGTVMLGANITKGGALTNLHVLSGPSMLRNAAMDAVKTWHYRPYLLDNQPVEVETTIRVVFSLDR